MDNKKIDDYLLDVMSSADREKFENKFFDDDELFFEIADRENTLVDRYVRGQLDRKDRERFERSLETFPARRKKVENARVLRGVITDERGADRKTITIAERRGLLSRITDIFRFGSPAFQFASVAMIAIIAIGVIVLSRQSSRLGALEQELAASREREAALESQLQNEQTATGDLTRDLDAERERIRTLQSEVAALRSGNGNASAQTSPSVPTIATLILSPMIRTPGQPTKTLMLRPGVKQVSVIVSSLSGVSAGDRVSAELNDHAVAARLPVTTKNEVMEVVLTIPSSTLIDGRNTLVIRDQTGKPIEERHFVVNRQR